MSYPHGELQAEAGRGAVGVTKRPASALEDIMTTEQKIIRAKVGLLELAKQLGNVSQACKMMGYSRDPAPHPADLSPAAILSTALEGEERKLFDPLPMTNSWRQIIVRQ